MDTEILPLGLLHVSCVDGFKPSDSEGDKVTLQCTGVDGGKVIYKDTKCVKKGLSTGYIILIVTLVLLFLLLLILCPLLCYFKKNRFNEDEGKDKARADIEMRPPSAYSYSNRVVVKGVKSAEIGIGNSNPFKLELLNEHIRAMTYDRNEGFIREFRSISIGNDTKKKVSQMAQNSEKNRYNNITTYDHSRVRLFKVNDDPYSDYINASYINGYQIPNAYIASQGPLSNTVNDFWRMIWEQHTTSVVMLTNLSIFGQAKCTKYWPETEETYGSVKVVKLSENKMRSFTIRELDVSVDKDHRIVYQYHYTDWPDRGYPKEEDFIKFTYYVRHMRTSNTIPQVVHCSAGSGWTGVFIAFDFTLDRMLKEDSIDVLGCVNTLRQQRSAMVQNEPQYIYLHKLLLDCVNDSEFSTIRFNRFKRGKFYYYYYIIILQYYIISIILFIIY